MTDTIQDSQPSLDAVLHQAAQLAQSQVEGTHKPLSADEKLTIAMDEHADAQKLYDEFGTEYDLKYPDRSPLTKALDQKRINEGVKLGQAVAKLNKTIKSSQK